MSIIGRLNKLSDILNERGFNKEASELKSIKEAALTGYPFFGETKHTPRLLSDRQPGKTFHEPTDPNIKPYEKGDFVIDLNPTTGKEELMLWDGKRLIPKKEIEEMVSTGAMREERLIGPYNKATPDVKAQLKPLLEFAKSKMASGSLPPKEIGESNYPAERLAYLKDCLEKRGYTLLVKKLKTAMDEYTKTISE
jgi:hypothetical protein